jgi:hypothetical protein
VAARSARVPARPRRQQRPRLVQGQPRPLRRPSRGPRPGPRRGPRASRRAALLPAVQRRALHHRPPIKEQLGIAIGYGGAGGYYVELSLDGLLIGAGLHHPATDQLERFRAAIDDGRHATAFERAVATAAQAGLTLVEPALKRAPRDYPLDHPRVERLRLKNLTLFARHALEPWLHEERCVTVVREELDATRPFVTWLGKHVGPSNAG